MVQEYDSNSTQPLGNDGYNSSGGSCTLPSVSQTTEIIITNKNLKESGYRNYKLIIKLLYSYIEKNNILPLNLKNDCSGMITLKNGESFPIFYKLRGKCRCFSILKDDLELFNTFLYENMPNNRMTVPQNPICLDKEVPILRKYICQILKTKHEHSFHISKIIYDACVNGERVSHDKILMTINSDASKPELRLIAHCRLFNGMICYALEKESISKINEYFEIAPVQFLLPQKGEISLQRLNSIYKCQPKDKYEQFKDIQRIIVQQIEAKRKEEPFTTTFNISLSYGYSFMIIPIYNFFILFNDINIIFIAWLIIFNERFIKTITIFRRSAYFTSEFRKSATFSITRYITIFCITIEIII